MKKKYLTYCSGLFSGLTMKSQKRVAFLLFMIFGVLNVQGQVTVAGAVTGDGSYTTLGAAFTAIGTSQTGANITIAITGNTTEAAVASLGAGNWTSLTISPSGGNWTISGDLASELIRFNGADNVTVNGLNSGGNGLTISNASTSINSGTSTLRFEADATNNTITNCTVLGSGTSPTNAIGGVIFFGLGVTTGNDGNTISNCNVGPAGTNLPSKLINGFSVTTNGAGFCNSGIAISNCNLYDYFLPAGNSAAVYIAAGNTDWTMTNNKIYQTGTRTFTAAGTMYGIYFSDSVLGDKVQITGNTIGYASNAGTGTFTIAGSVVGVFQGIYLNGTTVFATPWNINNNTISDISLTGANTSFGIFYGINNATLAPTSTGNAMNFTGNTIRNIELVTTNGPAYCLNSGNATTMSISNNSIYNFTRNVTGQISGIYDSNGSVNVTIADNTIHDLTSTGTLSNQLIYGIYMSSLLNGTKIAQNNTVYNFNSSAPSCIYYGIYTNSGTTVDFVGNTIYGFTHTGATGATIYGITRGSSATTVNISKNKIYGLSSTSSGPVLYGINIGGGVLTNISNNFIGDLFTPLPMRLILLQG